MRQAHPEYLANVDGHCTRPADVSILQYKIPELQRLRADAVEALYTQWSQEVYYAGWMHLTEDGIKRFEDWLTHGRGLLCVEHGIYGQIDRGDNCGPCASKLRQFDSSLE